MEALDHTRHSGIYDASYTSAVIIGAGGIGAITAITLAKMGLGYIEIWDGDFIEEVNVATQFHPATMLDFNKATAVGNVIKEHAPGVQVVTRPLMIDKGDVVRATIIIAALDSLEARTMVWDHVLKHEQSRWSWYIDARMGAEELQLWTVDNNNLRWDWYDDFIHRFTDDDIPELPCTEKATIYTANGAAAFIGATVRKLITKMPVPKIQAVNFVEGRIINA